MNLVKLRDGFKAYMAIDWEVEAFDRQSEPLNAAELALWYKANGEAV